MKHKEYAAGVLTGVLVVTLAAGGVKFVQQRQYNGVLSDSSHVQKIEYLEKMIDQEYLGEVDNAEMAEGHLCRSGLRSWRCLFQILYSR